MTRLLDFGIGMGGYIIILSPDSYFLDRDPVREQDPALSSSFPDRKPSAVEPEVDPVVVDGAVQDAAAAVDSAV